jgi:multidrug efflux system membrane fusion protein
MKLQGGHDMPRAGSAWKSAPTPAWIAVFCLTLIPFAEQGCANKASSDSPSKKGMSERATPVAVSTVVKKDIPINIQAIGTVEAYSTVTVRSQISGELVRVFFVEGDFVRKGEELFRIDSRSYEAQLNQVQANLAKDEAVLSQLEANLARDLVNQKYAQSEAMRYASLLEKHLVSKEQAEQLNASAEAAAAAVRADQAAIQSARASIEATKAALANAGVMLSYTRIQSPIDGRTGNLQIKQGNVINPNTNLMTINQVEPIYVSFSIPEAQLSMLKKDQIVTVAQERSDSPLENGKLFFIDNAVDNTTGTILVKAVFPNKGHKLWPGQFVRVSLRLGTRPNALIVPSEALQTGQSGPFIFVVKPDRTVESRPVTPGVRVDGDIAIEKGLEQGETVVTEGQLRLSVGGRVQFIGRSER